MLNCKKELSVKRADLIEGSKVQGEDLYGEMRDKLSIQEDVIAETTNLIIKYSQPKTHKNQRVAKTIDKLTMLNKSAALYEN